MKRLILITLLGLGACGETTPSPADISSIDVHEDAAEEHTDAIGVDSGGCQPGTRLCIDEVTWTECDDTGSVQGSNDCDEGTTCLDGHCRVPLCTPGTERCVSWTVRWSVGR